MAGTSGFSYKEWKGPFYPKDLAAKGMLSFYGERLPTVEINNTFYRLPKAEMLEGWLEKVPNHFRFAIKASRRITHMKRLKDCGDETAYLIKTIAVLGDRLGCILFQLPPNMRADSERLQGFLDILPDGTMGAFEFRHPSWFSEGIEGLLRERNMALVWADTSKETDREWPSTANWAYLRLRREAYADEDLVRWRQRIVDAAVDQAFVFFKHEDEGAAPNLALRLAHMEGV